MPQAGARTARAGALTQALRGREDSFLGAVMVRGPPKRERLGGS